jgi:hypothetical protein
MHIGIKGGVKKYVQQFAETNECDRNSEKNKT